MNEFVIRARKAPTRADDFLAAVGKDGRVEYLAQIFNNTLFVSKGHREDTILTFVLEDSMDYSRAITVRGDQLGSLAGTTESDILNLLASTLRLAEGLAKEAMLETPEGIIVQAISFEHLVKHRLETQQVYLLDKKGVDVRQQEFEENAVFLLTDHIPMPRKTFKSLKRQGVANISLGPIMLHASQCVVLIQNELDRQLY